MSITKKPYEISLWDEQLVWHRRKLEPIQIASKDDYKRGAYYVKSEALDADSYELSYEDYRNTDLQEENPYYQLAALTKDNCIEGNDSIDETTHPDWYKDGQMVPNVLFSFYKETRLCTIGSDTMDSPARAVNGKLVRKVNGEVTFTFTVYYRYYDNQTGQLEYNPFVPYLTNERKVKLKYDGEWYDLIIKQIQENSDSKAFTYTCKSQFVNELSKTGFELEFDNELENNMGTVEYLAEQILEGSDWRLEGKSDLKQFIEEPLYEVWVKIHPSYYEGVEILNPTKDFLLPPAKNELYGKKIYVFYSDIVNKRKDIQFLCIPPKYDSSFEVNDDLVINKDKYPNYVLKNVTYGKATDSNIDANGMEWPDFVRLLKGYEPIISPNYRGMRLVKQARSIYDAKIDKYVQEYIKEGSDIVYYGFEETKYLSPNAVNNYVVNPNAFTSISGWYVQPNAEGAKTTLELISDPPFGADNIGNESVNFTSYLKFSNNGGALVNSSINSHKSSLESFIAGETTYVLRLKCKEFKENEENKIGATIAPTTIKIQQYKNMDEFKIEGEAIFEFDKWNMSEDRITSTNEQNQDSSFTYYKATCKRAITQADLQNWDKYYGLFLTFDINYKEVCIEDIQMFLYVLDSSNRLCVPGGELFAKVETTKKYYNPTQEYSSLEEIEFEPAQPEGTYLLKYAEGAEAYTKVSSITAKESNRFNLLQDLNEKFECWARFRVEHNPDTGEILYGKDVGLTGDEAYRQQKFISFHEYAGQHNYVGFKYGINSKSIQRTLDSNAIVSKMIVKDNANEFARNGFCSIARATDNSSKENFVLSFDHYYRHKLLDLDIVTNDLYVDGNGYLGYYKKLKEINQDREALIEKQANLLKEIANYEAQHQTYKTSHDSAIEERNQMEDNIFLLIVPKEKREEASRLDFPEIIATYSAGWEEDSSYRKYTTSWMQCDNVIKQHLPLYQKAEAHLRDCEDEYETITETLKEKTEQKRALNLQFYKKYSRFIQEGSWIKEDYVDDNLYYLDSLSTLHTSAQPKVTYNISVIDVSPLPGYEDYEFELGDITYIEDREFFGYSLIDGTTPYREEIVVNEITTELDAPEKNSIKVQNYKTQFEDLFQRITAQTQQAEYHTGEYQRAASIVEPGGNISASTLENSFANNSFKLSNVRDQSVVIDSSGITSTSLANPNEMVRIVNGGIFMSTDGGQSWKTGLTGYGLNSSYLTAGQINTDEIYIMSGNQPAFGWDEKGISAYAFNGTSYDLRTCVRFDRYGIYGFNKNLLGEDKDVYNSVDEVMESAPFALTWKGFSLKNDDGSVTITSNEDIQVKEDNSERIKIGRLGEYTQEIPGDEDTPSSSVVKNLYGLRISSEEGTVMETDSEGELWLKRGLIVSTSDYIKVENLLSFEDGVKYYVQEGNTYVLTQDTEPNPENQYYIKEYSDGGITIGEVNDTVINANNTFIVYSDGRVLAKDGTFTGTINANWGKIGNLRLEDGNLISDQGQSFSIKITGSDGNNRDALTISNGEMTVYGIIKATDGGNIGGFEIRDGKLVSEKGGIELDGSGDGNIVANFIKLGTGAEIVDYIKLGEALIQNPKDNNRPFISAGNKKLEIYQDGNIKAGNITIDGPNSEIYGTNFSITPEAAHFDNVRVSGEIETAVFKQGSIQAAGGAMIFRPSYKIKDFDLIPSTNNNDEYEYTITLEEKYVGEVGNHVWIYNKNSATTNEGADNINKNSKEKVGKITEISGINITVRVKGTLSSPVALIDLGKYSYTVTQDIYADRDKDYYKKENGVYAKVNQEELFLKIENNRLINVTSDEEGFLIPNEGVGFNDKNNYLSPDLSEYYELNSELLMGINSGETSVGNGTILPRGLTIREFKTVASEEEKPALFLGDLNSLGGDYTGYGLYADNVYLNGSLTTRTKIGTYAGVNTISGAKGSLNMVGSEANIIFWAGAKEDTAPEIAKAPFQVTEDGYVYLAKSLIAGGELRAAVIRGWEDGEESALSIYDTSKGISFRTDDNNLDRELFSISTEGFKIEKDYFIKIEQGQAILKTQGDKNYISMQNLNGTPALYHYHSAEKTCGLFFEEKKTSFKFNIAGTETIAASFSNDAVVFGQNVELSSGKQKMQYKSVNNGYDLYIV